MGGHFIEPADLKNILITGATSAIGEAAIRWCRTHCSAERIIATGRNTDRLAYLKDRYAVTPGTLDLSFDQDDLRQRVAELDLPSIDTVLHFAAAVPSALLDPSEFYQINLTNSRLLFACLPLAESVSILNFSTSSVYDTWTTHVSEDSQKTCTNDYGISKYLFENHLEQICTNGCETEGFVREKIRTLSVRVPALLAPGIENNFISKWRSDIQNGNAVEIFNGDSLFNSCVWADDIFDFFAVFNANKVIQSLICNVGADEPVTLEKVFQVLSEGLGRCVELNNVSNNRPAQYYDCSLAWSHGFRPGTVVSSLQKFVGV